MLQQDEPDDYVSPTGKQQSVKEFIEAETPYHGIMMKWLKNNSEEVGYDMTIRRMVIFRDPKDFRLDEVQSHQLMP